METNKDEDDKRKTNRTRKLLQGLYRALRLFEREATKKGPDKAARHLESQLCKTLGIRVPKLRRS